MEILLISIALIAAILLILVVMVQPGKADMISGMGGFGGQMTNLLGVRQSRNILQNATMVLLGGLVLIAVVVNKFFLASNNGSGPVPVTQGAEIPQTSLPAAQRPVAQPAQQAQPAQPAAEPAQPAAQPK
jgi:protein translocase SecG subunit